VVVHYVDLKKRPIAPGELKRFTERLGAAALLDPTSRAYRDAGLGYLSLDQGGIVARLQADPRLLRLPLARHGNEVTVGPDEATWAAWLRPRGAA
jgi:arsenate reductase-like glutaredoxin family protein